MILMIFIYFNIRSQICLYCPMFVCLFSLCLCDSSSFADCVADSHLSIFLATCVFSYLLSVSLFKWLVISFSSALSALSLSGFDSLANSLANVVHFFFSFFCVSSILFIVLPVFTLLFLLPFFFNLCLFFPLFSK